MLVRSGEIRGREWGSEDGVSWILENIHILDKLKNLNNSAQELFICVDLWSIILKIGCLTT